MTHHVFYFYASMKTGMTIKQRIHLSFLLLGCLFMINAIMTNIILRNNNRLSDSISKELNPSLKALDDFKMMLLESKMYTTNWVFLRYKEGDKRQLKKLHNRDYAALKSRINSYSNPETSKAGIDGMQKVFAEFEELIEIEKKIMLSLQAFKDYDNPVVKLEAERKVEDDILPRTGALMNSLNRIYDRLSDARFAENVKLERSSSNLKIFTTLLAIATIGAGFFLSLYLAKVIIAPVKKINRMINDLGKGMLRKIDHNASDDEIGSMIHSVNNLSDSLQSTASFAHETGMRNFDMPFQPLSDDDTLGKALITMRENLKTGDANLEMQNKELERKNKELEQFAYVASHDLQEPMQTTISFVELFQKHYKATLDERGNKYLSYIVEASERMNVFITDLLEYSRIGARKEKEPVDCNAVLNEVINELNETIEATGTEIKAQPLPMITGYQTEIRQLFQHLTCNAIKFGKKDIPPKIKIEALQKKDEWQFSFSDNGIGISKENNERIFIIFQRLHTRNQYKGSGIGLSHCKKIVELHKGKIWLESELGQGTTFYFTLPTGQTGIPQNINS